MKRQSGNFYKVVVSTAALLLFAACATPLTAPEGAEAARAKLTSLQSSPDLASRAPVELKDAEAAVIAAEVPRTQQDAYGQHLVLIADKKVEIAAARAQSRLYEDQRRALKKESETIRLEARTQEADRARIDAIEARADATAARDEADLARQNALSAQAESEDLQLQIDELNARETDRGLVVTLGDLLFETGRADLKGGATSNLDKLALFLGEYPDRTVLIEGHTDNVGSDDQNLDLSNRRAYAVRSYLADAGISGSRLSSTGMGESAPIASNDTDTGRQQNRRVEIIISNSTTASATG
jgi:outer membrane protein OmpA-like peptidoglycan-associated protein